LIFCKNINIFNDSSWPEIKIKNIIDHLKNIIPNNSIKNPDFLFFNRYQKEPLFYQQTLIHYLKEPSWIYELKGTRNDIDKGLENYKKKVKPDLSIYDGFLLQKAFQLYIKNDELLSLSHLNILIIDKLLCTFDETDWKHHARSVICGNPTLISTSGIVEGIAKPREYYYRLYSCNENPELLRELKREYEEKFIDYYDIRINDVIEGLVIQSLFYFINSGSPFCENRYCRLFNAHFQDDLIRAHINHKLLCDTHQTLLNNYNHLFMNDY
jgi:hypothetical protein